MASGHLLLSCAKRAATTKIDLFAYLWQLPCALCSLILMTLVSGGAYQDARKVSLVWNARPKHWDPPEFRGSMHQTGTQRPFSPRSFPARRKR